MRQAKALLNARVSRILTMCQMFDHIEGYSYRFDLSTSTDELILALYHHTPGDSIRRVMCRRKLDLTCADVMEDFKNLENELLHYARKKASVVTADY